MKIINIGTTQNVENFPRESKIICEGDYESSFCSCSSTADRKSIVYR